MDKYREFNPKMMKEWTLVKTESTVISVYRISPELKASLEAKVKEMVDWCDGNVKGRFSYQIYYAYRAHFYFRNPRDAMMFKLIYS